MIKILKLIFIVALATLVGLWASKYHGYVTLVIADKVIRMNLVAFVFAAVALLFLGTFGYRLVKLIFNLPYLIFSWFFGLFAVSKQEQFIDLVADISLERNKILARLSVAKIVKLTPAYLREYFLFRKLTMIASDKGTKNLATALKSIDKKLCIYSFFVAYKFYLEGNLFEAQAKIRDLLTTKNTRLKANIVNLAAKIALANKDSDFTFEILEKYSSHLEIANEEGLIILALQETKDLAQAKEIYGRTEETASITRVYIEQLIKLNEATLAQKVIKKHINEANIEPKMLSIYINAFNGETAKLYSKVCSEKNSDIDSVLTLLDLTMMKSDNPTFKLVHDYIEAKLTTKLTEIQLERYKHILCKFYIKNGSLSGIDLSESRLVYENY